MICAGSPPSAPLLFDHPDPSIFSVLTAPSGVEGTAKIHFVIFPERWQVAEHSFRPPWFHMNVMSEFMGLIFGLLRREGRRVLRPAASRCTTCMLPHGPDAQAFAHALPRLHLQPEKLTDTLAFMFETSLPSAPHAPTPPGSRPCSRTMPTAGRAWKNASTASPEWRNAVEFPGSAAICLKPMLTREMPHADLRL